MDPDLAGDVRCVVLQRLEFGLVVPVRPSAERVRATQSYEVPDAIQGLMLRADFDRLSAAAAGHAGGTQRNILIVVGKDGVNHVKKSLLRPGKDPPGTAIIIGGQPTKL